MRSWNGAHVSGLQIDEDKVPLGVGDRQARARLASHPCMCQRTDTTHPSICCPLSSYVEIYYNQVCT
ncbi:hypothetical protein F751_6872 [Auxenochlorella protothecoides]|uniref:Uncharacterized protein n=1 Tax=Auxenochlorella protothecoides TaxID=3075 RepID=A0A087SDV0_AUXPR|nr:hypothetical protein F751_6872 [Auxenochlorella protothecoides]KFM23904.1 hypothetical protein F751_6872 [Auxenochlorella protothecoides]